MQVTQADWSNIVEKHVIAGLFITFISNYWVKPAIRYQCCLVVCTPQLFKCMQIVEAVERNVKKLLS